MRSRKQAIGILITGLVYGIFGHFLFFERFPGLGIPLFIALLLTAIVGWATYSSVERSIRRFWLIVPILFFSSLWAIRSNEVLLAVDALAVLTLGSLFIHYLTRTETVDEVSTIEQGIVTAVSGLGSAFGPFSVLQYTLNSIREEHIELGRLTSIVRGLLFAVPVVLVFGALLSSADVVFASKLETLFGFLIPESFDAIIAHVLATGFFAWGSTGVIYYAVTPRTHFMPGIKTLEREEDTTQAEESDGEFIAKKTPRFLQFDLTESGIVLGSIVLLFAAFVFIQFTYLFGGQTIIDEALTYAQYARRGFFELVTVSIMVLGLILVLDFATLRKSTNQNSIFRMLSIILIAETLVVLASAWRRMSLYEIAYGFTHLRLFTHVFMIWLGLLLGVGILSLFRVRKNIFSFGLLLIAIGYLASLNIMNADQYIATRNIERYQEGYELDLCYLTELSLDALEPLVNLHASTTDEIILIQLEWWFSRRQHQIENRYSDYFFLAEYHYGEQRARQTLSTIEYSAPSYTERICSVQRN